MSCTGKRVFPLLWRHHSTQPPRVQFCLQNLSFRLRLLPKQHSIFCDVQPGWDDSYRAGLMRGKRRKRGKGTAGLSGELGLKELQHLSRSHSCWSIPFSGEGGREKTCLLYIHCLSCCWKLLAWLTEGALQNSLALRVRLAWLFAVWRSGLLRRSSCGPDCISHIGYIATALSAKPCTISVH